jgi:Tfp pilus assembly protein PilX
MLKPVGKPSATPRAKVTGDEGITLVVVLMLMAILLSVIGAGLLFSGVNTKITVSYQQGTRAFYAADAGLGEAVSQLSANQTAVEAITINPPRDLSGDGRLRYRGGGRTAPASTPVAQYVGSRIGTGDTLSSGLAGYNESNGYSYYQYQLNVTGTYQAGGTELAGRSVEAQALFGPVAQ